MSTANFEEDEAQNQSASALKKRPGRKPKVTQEHVLEAIEELRRQRRTPTPGGGRSITGGAPSTVARLLETIQGYKPTINVDTRTPNAIDKASAQSLDLHSIAIRAECQAQLDQMQTLLSEAARALFEERTRSDKVDEACALTCTERGELRGQLAAERELRIRVEAEAAQSRQQAEPSDGFAGD